MSMSVEMLLLARSTSTSLVQSRVVVFPVKSTLFPFGVPVIRISLMKLSDEPCQFQTTCWVLVLVFTGIVGIESNKYVLSELFDESLKTTQWIVWPASASDFWMTTTFSCLY